MQHKAHAGYRALCPVAAFQMVAAVDACVFWRQMGAKLRLAASTAVKAFRWRNFDREEQKSR
ncbi:hypothetical protein [Sphingobium sp. BS19]|jgi:hypothetical protein|uniref:hypothetical protein n=1 Tax=Sphingobium sp. BS19 TaxID=3018973 RepID=UPI00249121CA|nr:hypothetical protein [Sphingobium sp. BS19]|tara:strand:- start:2264 stop:2449 length:186 start_codon:yes stop_codon:yes gene_type:complete